VATRGGGVYFPVDAGFCDTQAARQVSRRYGAEGFAAYVRLLCMMLREDGGRLSVELEDDWEDVADQLGMGSEDARGLVATLAHYGAVVVEGGRMWSPLVSESIAARDEISEKRRKAAEARWAKDKKREEPEE
jgi:hypothetical protein